MGIIKDALDGIALNIKVRAAMPGHKGKIKVDSGHDITELTGADNLQKPEGILKSAQEAAARLYGVKSARYLVNGSTCGNLTMIFSFFNEGDQVIIERNCHKSVYNAMLLRKLVPVYLWPEFDGYNNSLPQRAGAVREALARHPQAKGIVLTQPSYKGHISDYEAIWSAARDQGVFLLLDAAHGSALAGDDGFRDFYGSCDAMVVSTHKSLGCLNQGSVLLLNRPEFAAKILKYSNMFQTSSPSYLIMESIESSLEDLAAGLYKNPPVFAGADFKNLVLNPVPEGMRQDPWKLLIYSQGNGAFMETFLEANGIFPELHDTDQVLLMLSPFNGSAELEYLRSVLGRLDEAADAQNHGQAGLGPKKEPGPGSPAPPKFPGQTKGALQFPPPPKRVMLPFEAGDDFIEVSLEAAPGRIAQEQVIPYPPGFPVLVPGEVIDEAMVAYINKLQGENVAILGLYDNKLRCLREEN